MLKWLYTCPKEVVPIDRCYVRGDHPLFLTEFPGLVSCPFGPTVPGPPPYSTVIFFFFVTVVPVDVSERRVVAL